MLCGEGVFGGCCGEGDPDAELATGTNGGGDDGAGTNVDSGVHSESLLCMKTEWYSFGHLTNCL